MVPPSQTAPWQIWIDTGGTFTDCLARDPAGAFHRAKVLSSSALRGRVEAVEEPRTLRLATAWEAPAGFLAGTRFRRLADATREGVEVTGCEPLPGGRRIRLAAPAPGLVAGEACELRFAAEAPVLAARLVTGSSAGASLPAMALRLATTRGTNALLTRGGARVALFTTRGFADLLAIGTQQRPDLFALAIDKPAPLVEAVVEVDERLAADGSVLVPLTEAALEEVAAAARDLAAAGFDGAAVALLHSYRNPRHEERVAAVLRRTGLRHVVSSAELAPLIQILPRAETAVVEAYLAPVIRDYIEGVTGALGEGSAHVMTSAGGLVEASRFRAKDSLLSGPAGGVVGAALAGRRSGFDRVIAFDMGGTSTDVARVAGDFEYVFEHRVGDARLVAPALAIESVAAGGGSVCRFDGQRLRVGPASAGARPGPACYGAGGPLTLTDVNLLLGRLDPGRFEIPLDREAAAAAADAVTRQVGEGRTREALLEGFLTIADERMADAIRGISVRRGYDPRRYALVAFGGAGAQHACAVAELLGVRAILVPRDAGLLSALGLGAAVVERFVHRQVLEPLAEVAPRLPELLEELAAEARRAVAWEGVGEHRIEVRRRILNLRFEGQDSTLAVEPGEDETEEEAFAAAYRALYGYRPEGRRVELESVRVVASSIARQEVEAPPVPPPTNAFAARSGQVWLGGGWRRVPIHEREALAPGVSLGGPALVFERHSATLVSPGWRLTVDAVGALVLHRA